MKIEVCLSLIQVPLENLSKVLPKYSHLKKLEHLPKLHEKANRRVISPTIGMNEITGYNIQEFSDTIYRDTKHFTTKELDSMPLD